MIPHPVLGNNSGELESFPQQNDVNSQFENSRDPELVNANTLQSIHAPDVQRINRSSYSSATRFFKTRMCVRFLKGKCPNGNMCNYAHGVRDLRQPSPNWQELDNHERVQNRESSVIVIQTLPNPKSICYNLKTERVLHGLPEVQRSVGGTVSERQKRPTKSGTTVRQQKGGAKGFAKLAHMKLKGIYADWIDEK